ncbi:hypothetical protein QY96_03062 [Bacillus thermotolerans]|uniref:Uncharacterized protein n=1 Tax=Bacillus thermotolerans TaxID=1221996 RepID=A0A0F5HWR9_BACTR|nr:hypothetical protein QY95_02788 [Bacillus thermotolerans]KKB38375.1 hypothetical protein QY96_03062 [Bacillus thermotolerans]
MLLFSRQLGRITNFFNLTFCLPMYIITFFEECGIINKWLFRVFLNVEIFDYFVCGLLSLPNST